MPADHKQTYYKRRNSLRDACLDKEAQDREHVANECKKNEDKESNT